MKRSQTFALVVAGLCVSLASCVAITPASGDYASASTKVHLDETWSDMSALSKGITPKAKRLTLDGPALNELYIVGGLKSGETLIRARTKDKPTPAFRKDLSFSEQVEFVTDSLTALGYFRVEAHDMRPQPFGTAQGLRFDIDAQNQEGLNIDGTVLATIANGELNLILFVAPEEHYYPALQPRIEKLMSGAQVG